MLGLAVAAFAQLLSLFLAGAGHGWLTPMPASLLLWVLTPIALLVAWPGENPGLKILLPLILVAMIANLWLIKRMIDEEHALPFYLEVNGAIGFLIVGAWIGSWLLWQAIAIGALLSGSRGQ